MTIEYFTVPFLNKITILFTTIITILTCYKLPIQKTGFSCDKLHGISWNSERNINTANDVIFDVIKLNDTGKITVL